MLESLTTCIIEESWQNDPDFKGNIAERIYRVKADHDFVLDDGLLE